MTTTRGAVIATAGTALMATFLMLTACGAGNDAGEPQASTPSSSAATEASTDAAQPQFDRRAVELLNAILRDDFDAATTDFDSRMKKELSPQALCSVWGAYQEEFGDYQSHGDPDQIPRGELTVVNVPLQMAKQDGEFRVTFDRDGSVAGLYFLRAGVPVP